jgi:GNAT superfamily N-acetyltransferase
VLLKRTSPYKPNHSNTSNQAEGLYLCFPEDWWAKKEPPELRPAGDVDSSLAIRTHRMAQRLTPAITDPHHCFMKAVYTPTGETVGIAGWTLPSNPNVHSLFRRSAVAHYSWAEKMGWSDADVDVMWSHVSNENWSERFAKDDAVRAEAVGGGRHWYLAPLLTWPGWQGRGVGKRLMDWAMKRADAEGEVMYLESRPSARAVYLHLGFEACGEYNMIRRGPKGVGKSGAERNLENEKGEEFRVEVVAKESETDGAR